MLQQMLASMLGMTEEEMTETMGGMQTLLKDGVQKLNEIHAQNVEILALLKGRENDNRDSNGNSD